MALSLSLGCGAPEVERAPQSAAEEPAVDYLVRRGDEGPGELEVEVCVRGFSPRRYALLGGDAIVSARREGRADRPLIVERGRSVAVDSRVPGCLVYRVRIDHDGGAAQALNEGLLLARPEGAPPEARVSVVFDESVGPVVTPYRISGRRHLPAASFWRRSTTWAFPGGGVVRELDVDGVEIRLAILPGERAISDDALIHHLTRVLGRARTLAPSRYPGRIAVVVTPSDVRAGEAPIPFGVVRRGGGASVLFVLSDRARFEDLEASDWVSMHELAHLAFPAMRRSEAWLTEGWATYFQEVLRAREGLVEPREAWRRLHRGFEDGRAVGTGRPLHRESAEMWENYAFKRVYWSGAAHALEVDLALRARGERLEGLLEELFEGVGFDRWVSFEDYLERLEARGYEDLAERARVARAANELPSLAPSYEALGLLPRGRRLEFDESDERVSLRSAIVGGDR